MLEITSKNQLNEVMSKNYDLVVLDIYADWCGPCKYLTPKLEAIAETYEKANANVLFCKLNNDTGIRNVQGLPTIEFWLKEGNRRNMVHHVMGANLSEIQSKLEEYISLPITPPSSKTNTSVGTQTHNPAIKNVSAQMYQEQPEPVMVRSKQGGKTSNYKTFSGL